MSTKQIVTPTKIRGGQAGNHNARTHGFYSRELTVEQQEALDAAHGVQALDQEIALLRLKILAIANSPIENYPAFLMALSLLTKMITVDMEFKRLEAEKEASRIRAEEYQASLVAEQKAKAKHAADFARYVRQIELEHKNDPKVDLIQEVKK